VKYIKEENERRVKSWEIESGEEAKIEINKNISTMIVINN